MSSDPFLDAEASIESSQPREFFDIVQSAAVTYRIASGVRDITYNGNVYTAQPAARTEITTSSINNEAQLTLALPLSHPFVQRYLNQGSPPRQVLFTLYRQQPGGLFEQYSNGVVTSLSIEKHVAKLLVQSRLVRHMRRTLPVVAASRFCQNVLFDGACRVDRNLYSLGVFGTAIPVVTVTSFDGRRVVVSWMNGNADQWAQFGDLIHVPTGERMPILDQTGLALTLQAPIPDIAIGDRVQVSAGCAHDIATCRVKFGNQINFVGTPQLPTKNPFIPTGRGVVEQS